MNSPRKWPVKIVHRTFFIIILKQFYGKTYNFSFMFKKKYEKSKKIFKEKKSLKCSISEIVYYFLNI